MIEKNIFQIWKNNQLPYYLKIFANSWKKQKGFQYFLHTDESMEAFVNEKYPEIHDAFGRLKIVEKTDLFRLMLVYEFGGLYSDLDTSCNKDLNILWREFPEASFIAGVEADTNIEVQKRTQLPRLYQLCNWTFAAEKSNPVLKKIIDRIIKNIHENPELNTLEKTGPAVFTDVILENNQNNAVTILPIKYFGAGQKHSNSPSRKEGFVIHYFLGSWKKEVSLSKKIRFRFKSWFLD